MSKQTVRLARRQAFALAAVLALVLGMLMITPTAFAQENQDEDAPAGEMDLTNAEFRWGLNDESRTKGLAPGTFNYFSAGDVTDSLPGGYSNLEQDDWLASQGDVRIEKRGSNGKAALATWKGTQTDRAGQEIARSGSADSGLEIVFRGGEGSVDPATGEASISWKGTATVLYYSGYAVFTISDPVLSMDKAEAKVTATLGGYESSRTDTGLWEKISPPMDIVIADLDPSAINLDGDKGFNVAPEYFDVSYAGGDQVNNEHYGSFPQSFVDFVDRAGIGPFFYSTGGAADGRKDPLDIAVSWDATDAVDVSTSTSKGMLAQVIDDTIEDVLRAAGTDAADTAAAWMDEAWKPLQPDAVKAAQADAAAANGAAAPDDGTGVSEVDAEFEGYYEEYYTAGAPITAGTVAATVGSIPASPSRSSAAPASPPANNSADQATVQMAATSPVYGADVVYAQTSASSEAGSSSSQWQWWVGVALLAIAAMLFFQTVRRKD